VFSKLWQYSPKAFFFNILELRSLEDKYKLLSTPFPFRLCLYKYHPSCPTTRAWLLPEILTILCRTQNRTPLPLFQYYTGSAMESDRSGKAAKIPECVNVSLSSTCTTADSVAGRRPGIVVDNSGRYPAAGRPKDRVV
jgi:hypothetical protein